MAIKIDIAGREIGRDCPCFIIAEVGVNHNGDLELAKQLVDIAAQAGVDAVKFQTFTAERVVSSKAPKAKYQRQTTGEDESQLEMLQQLELSPQVHGEIKAYCEQQGLLFMSTPFDEESVDMLDELGLPVFKIGSGEVTNWPFLSYVARKGKPILLSTGMSYLSEVEEATRVIHSVGNKQLVLLHCVSNYPAEPTAINLRAMQTMATALQSPLGYSDHTLGIEVALAAVALGACVIEKHVTLDKDLPGPDHRASLEPDELQSFVAGIRTVEQALGSNLKQPAQSEIENRAIVRRSLAAARDIPIGTVLKPEMLTALRPANGISPTLIEYVTGRTTKRKLTTGQLIAWNDLG